MSDLFSLFFFCFSLWKLRKWHSFYHSDTVGMAKYLAVLTHRKRSDAFHFNHFKKWFLHFPWNSIECNEMQQKWREKKNDELKPVIRRSCLTYKIQLELVRLATSCSCSNRAYIVDNGDNHKRILVFWWCEKCYDHNIRYLLFFSLSVSPTLPIATKSKREPNLITSVIFVLEIVALITAPPIFPRHGKKFANGK